MLAMRAPCGLSRNGHSPFKMGKGEGAVVAPLYNDFTALDSHAEGITKKRGFMNIDTLREFSDLAHTMSFTKTAKRFFISQPVLSKHISNLERELGTQLVLRTKNGIQLTEAGKFFAKETQRLIMRYESILAEMEYIKSGRERPLNLGYLQGASAPFLPQALAKFKHEKNHPEVRYLTMEIDEIFDALERNAIDMAITTGLHDFDDDVYAQRLLYPDMFCLIAPKRHPLAQQDQVSVEDLRGCELIVPHSTFMPEESKVFEEILRPLSNDVRRRYLIGDLGSIQMALVVEGCAALEFAHLRHLYQSADFSFVPLAIPTPEFSVRAVWKRSGETQAILDLADIMTELTAKMRLETT